MGQLLRAACGVGLVYDELFLAVAPTWEVVPSWIVDPFLVRAEMWMVLRWSGLSCAWRVEPLTWLEEYPAFDSF